MEEHLSCPICCHRYRDLVVLQCSHSFCEECLQKYWENTENVTCPMCGKKCSIQAPGAGQLESQRKSEGSPTGPQDICPLHGEKLKLFCFDDKQPICVVCYTSKKHKGHECNPIEEAVSELRSQLTTPLQMRMTNMNAAKVEHQKWTDHIQAQSQRGEEQIRKEFLRLRQFLEEEESARITALREEETQKCKLLRDKTDTLTKNISNLSETIGEIEVDDVTFLQTYKAILDRVKSTTLTPLDTTMPPGMLIDMVKHVGSLRFNIWAKMAANLDHYPVTMDPNTASTKLLVTDDLTRVTFQEERQGVPDNPERFQIGVLGSEGYRQGCHYWDVDVGDNDNWTLGVVKESIACKKRLKFDPNDGLWSISYISGKYRIGVKPRREIHVVESLRVIRVKLNYIKGELQLQFINQSTNTVLCILIGKLTEVVYPYFNSSCLNHPLQLCGFARHF